MNFTRGGRNQIWYKTIPSTVYVQILIQFMYVLPCSTNAFCICDLIWLKNCKKERCVLSCDISVWWLVAVSPQKLRKIRKENSRTPRTNGCRDMSKFLNPLFPSHWKNGRRRCRRVTSRIRSPRTALYQPSHEVQCISTFQALGFSKTVWLKVRVLSFWWK